MLSCLVYPKCVISVLNKVRNTAARKLIQGKRENNAFSSLASSSILFSLTSPSLGPHLAQIPKSMQIYSRDKGTKMAINLTKNRDSLLNTWKNVFDDTPDVNW